MKQAKKYYLLAQKHASNDEQRAKIAYMLAKVERNEYYRENFFCIGNHQEWYKNKSSFHNWEAFKELRKYPHTKYYKEVIAECGDFN